MKFRTPGCSSKPACGASRNRAPTCAPWFPSSQLEFVLVPGVAFTARCERLGYGGGFYDRFIGGLASRPALIAAAYSLQLVPELPVSESDQRVDLVITENAEYSRESSIVNRQS